MDAPVAAPISPNSWESLIAAKHNSPDLSDIKIIVRGEGSTTRLIPAHRFVLASRSPKLAVVINQLLQQSDPKIDLSNYPAESVECLLEHIYTFKTNIPKEPADASSAVMSLANLYELPGLQNACSELFKAFLSPGNACEQITACAKFGPKNMPEICLESLSQDPKTGLSSASWNSLPQHVLAELLESDNLFIDEAELFKALLRWAESQHREVPKELLRLIRFPLMTPAQLSMIVQPSKLLTPDELFPLFLFAAFPEPNKDTAGYCCRGRVPPILSNFKISPPLGVVVREEVVRYCIEVPNGVHFFTKLHITNGGSLKCPSWDPATQTGGTLVIVAASIVIDAGGSIDADGCGWKGGAGNGVSVPQVAFQGESYREAGPPVKTGDRRKGGGGGGQSYQNGTVGGGGGGYGTAGGRSSTNVFGEGGEVYGEESLDKIYLGSGGGGGSLYTTQGVIPNGGNGGGAIIIITHSLVCNGKIVANGQKGGDATGIVSASGGGGGSGGSIFIAAKELSGGGSITAIGGVGGLQGDNQYSLSLAAGGNGGHGRIRIDALKRQITSNPVFFDGNGRKAPNELARYR